MFICRKRKYEGDDFFAASAERSRNCRSVETLRTDEKPVQFVGQGQAGGSNRGISQKEQMRVVREFQAGNYNTLVATCIGEEGLDIGEVDLIVCYDAPSSPTRLVQRMGRTGRKRNGKIVVLVSEGKEEHVSFNVFYIFLYTYLGKTGRG